MINTSKYFRDSVRLSGRENVDCYVMIGGTKVDRHNIKSLTVNYELGNDGIPSIGNAPSQSINLTLYRRDNVPNYLRLDQTVVPYIGFYVFTGSSWRYEYVKMGTFYIPNSDNVTKNDLEISMTCFDNMARMEDENRKRVQIDYNKPEIPTGTIKTVCQYLSRKAGITFDYSSIEDDVAVTVSPAGWNIRQVLQELAFLQGKNCIVDRDNRFKFVKPKEVPFTEFNIKAKNAISMEYKADLYSTMAAIKCEQLNYTRINDEVNQDEHTYEIIEGNGSIGNYDPDEYEEGTPLVDNNVTGVMFHTSTVTSLEDLEAVYNRCMPYTFYNYELETQGFPQVEIGDIITFVNKEGTERQLLIASHKVVYDGGCKSTFSATGKDSEYVDVEDIEWWDLKDRDPDEDKNTEEKFTEHYFSTGSNYYSKDGIDFDGNYMAVDTTITTKITDENGDIEYKYETDYDELVAPSLIKLDSEGHKIHVGKLELDGRNRWQLTEVETMEVGTGTGSGCDCADKIKDLENRIKHLEECCEKVQEILDDLQNPTVKYTLTIKYQYQNGSQAAPDYTAVLKEGSTYSVKSPTINKYEPDKASVDGTITGDTTIIVTYIAGKATITVNYTYVYGGTAATTYSKQHDYDSTYSIPSPTISNHTPDKATISGTVTKSETFNVVYTPISCKLTVHYVYDTGGTASPDVTRTGAWQASYSVDSPNISGYETTTTTVTGNFDKLEKEVTVIYKKITIPTNYILDQSGSPKINNLMTQDEYTVYPFDYSPLTCLYFYNRGFSANNDFSGAMYSSYKNIYLTRSTQALILQTTNTNGAARNIYIVRPGISTGDSMYNDKFGYLEQPNEGSSGGTTVFGESQFYYNRIIFEKNSGYTTNNYLSAWVNDGVNSNSVVTYAPTNMSRLFVKVLNNHASGYVTLAVYGLDPNNNMRVYNYINISSEIATAMTGLNLSYSAQIRTKHDEEVTIDYNPSTKPNANGVSVIPSYGVIGYKNIYDMKNGPFFSTLINDTRPYSGGALIGFGYITGDHVTSGNHYVDYKIVEGILIKSPYHVGIGGFAEKYLIS